MKYKQALQTLVYITSLMSLLLLAAYATAKPSVPQQQLQALAEALENKRVEYHIPGMAIAVVKDDEIIMSQAFGMQDLAKQQAVTTDTLFATGSTAKAFTATLVGMLVDAEKLTWDDEVTQYLPDYQFKTAGKELPITLRDMLSHRTGYTRNDLLWANGQASRELVLETATKAEPWDDFRSSFHYNNVMYLAAGEITGQLHNSSWDAVLKKQLFTPLGMQNSTTDHATAIQDERTSLGYQWNEETQTHDLLPRRNLNNVAPAGGIYSNVKDMAQWVRFQLNQGQINGQSLISAEQLKATWQTQINVAGEYNYGMGWFLREWQGQKVVEHGGNIDGYAAQVALLPESKLGFVLLTNVTATPLQQESINLVWEHLAAVPKPLAKADDTGFSYDEYVGEYHANFATFKDSIFTFLIKPDGTPAVDVPGQTVYDLKDPDESGKWYFAMTDTIAVSFDRAEDGGITAMRMHQNRLDFELPRKGVVMVPEIDASELQPYLGQYQSEVFNGPINVVIQNHRLTLDVPNQMAFELDLPGTDGFRQFRIKSDMSAKFEANETGVIEKLVLYRDHEKVVDTAPKMASEPVAALPTVAAIMQLKNTAEQKQALKRNSGFTMNGRINMINSGITGTITTQFDHTVNYRQVMDFGVFGQIEVAANEDTAASIGISPYTEFVGKYLQQIRLEHPAVSIDWRDHVESIQTVGSDEIEGVPVYVLNMKPKDLPTSTLFVNSQNGDLLRQQTKLLNPTVGSIPVTIDYRDYQVHHGLRIPMSITIKNPMMGLSAINYETVEAKQKFKPALFVIEEK